MLLTFVVFNAFNVSYSAAQGLKLGKLAQPLRAALTGTTVSPGIFDVLEVLGRDEALGRLKDQVS